MDERSIDVEKKQALLVCCHIEKNDEIPMTNDEGMTKINLRTLSESNDEKLSSLNAGIFSGFVIQACFDIRHSCFVISLNRFVKAPKSFRNTK